MVDYKKKYLKYKKKYLAVKKMEGGLVYELTKEQKEKQKVIIHNYFSNIEDTEAIEAIDRIIIRYVGSGPRPGFGEEEVIKLHRTQWRLTPEHRLSIAIRILVPIDQEEEKFIISIAKEIAEKKDSLRTGLISAEDLAQFANEIALTCPIFLKKFFEELTVDMINILIKDLKDLPKMANKELNGAFTEELERLIESGKANPLHLFENVVMKMRENQPHDEKELGSWIDNVMNRGGAARDGMARDGMCGGTVVVEGGATVYLAWCAVCFVFWVGLGLLTGEWGHAGTG